MNNPPDKAVKKVLEQFLITKDINQAVEDIQTLFEVEIRWDYDAGEPSHLR